MDNSIFEKVEQIEKKYQELGVTLSDPNVIQDYEKTFEFFSKGELKRIEIAYVFTQDFDLLILDEITNHLDFDIIIWIESYLKKLTKALFLITHDRYFLQNVCTEIFEIERKDCDRVRKDYSTLSTIWDEISYFFDFNYTLENFKNDMLNLDIVEVEKIVKEYIENYDTLMQNHDDWFNSLKSMAEKYGYCVNNKEFNQEIHKGKVADFVAIFRYLITGRKNSPDLFSVMKVLGKDESIKRLDIFNK